ncbi:DUF1307 domain-containing protein [Vagococcus fluvialis]|uniref:DUF1307 domain-containing protein n=2 Tax=Bacteria TaxID=2 RepID=UPI001A8F0189|nr:DUF1307 domain-containing protein [Vagococcus fluvialis]MBO0480415.1 DUF1307 domain-containing protein [Vagococcus fluvialis]MBO0484268.1 DUF1307 domain-containing protein [Vagococcus fluvialis]UDM71345.1 DUF1307 domain-containing protein [Vagococcus fluvialis]UDM76207.1 DUF1307 domain-containing protein [Vagococcus fluvialis]UDM83036.1 DUF1307 domain-containing protein [Vagococcus fluvialis]
MKYKTFIMMVSLLFLSSCSSKKQNIEYYFSAEGTSAKTTFELKDKVAINQVTESRIDYESMDIKNKTDGENKLKSNIERYNNIEGVDYTIEFRDYYLIEKTYIDYEKVKKNDFQKLNSYYSDKKELTGDNINTMMNKLGFSKSSDIYLEAQKDQNEVGKYLLVTNKFNEISISDVNQKKENIFLFIGFKECPYCRIFAPKLLEAVQNTNKKVYYLNTNTITESEEENRLLEALELDTVPALYLLEKDGEYREFKFENSENVEVKEIENFLKQN